MDRRNGRRRRVLRDEARPEEENSGVAKKKQGAALAYSESALKQPSLTALIPVRPLRVLTTWLSSLCILIGLVVLDDWSSSVGIASFQLGQPGSLASWFASTLLMWAAAGATLTFLIRRHRKDDYRGAYHIWIWAAILLVLTSIAATSPWHRHWNRGLTVATGVDLGEHGWWLATLGVIAGGMLIRVAIDIRACRTALCLLVTACGGYISVALLETQTLLAGEHELGQLASQFGLLSSHLTLAYAVWWNARYVQLDAQGVHAERAAKRAASRQARDQQRAEKQEAKLAAQREREQAKASRKSGRRKAVKDSGKAEDQGDQGDQGDESTDAAGKSHGKRRKASSGREASSKEQDTRSEPADQEEEPDTLKLDPSLSKSERRRQRKQQKRRAAA